MDFRKIVRDANAGRSLTSLAAKSGVHVSTLHKWLSGANECMYSCALEAVLEAIGATVSVPDKEEFSAVIGDFGYWTADFRCDGADASWIGAGVKLAGAESVERDEGAELGHVGAVKSPEIVTVVMMRKLI